MKKERAGRTRTLQTQTPGGQLKAKLKVWWIPQVPMKPFEVEVSSVLEGRKIMDVLGAYDAFQYENNIKPDYSNAGGIMTFVDGEWEDVEDVEDEE